MNKSWIAKSAALCACALLLNGLSAVAEEKRLGDYIYVPAMQVSRVTGSISLRVEGLALQDESDAPVTIEALPGAEFGVYVFSGSGELTPWANPLYPSEPMRIRTGEGETHFSLPQGAEYYLRQESAPQGYLFDDEALIPVVGSEIVVRNEMAGELLVSTMDTLGVPVSGVQLRITDEEGKQQTVLTDENGEATIKGAAGAQYLIEEEALPEGVFAARSVLGGEVSEQGVLAGIACASRTRVTFEHPASGTVELNMQLGILDDHAMLREQPLADVRLDIASEPPISVVTDAQGQARASLLEGTYNVALRYEGEQDVLLPVEQAQMVVESGSTTVIDLTASETTGRIVLTAGQSTGSVTFVSEKTGRVYGPYDLDAEGMAVSQPLPAGGYRVAEMKLDASVELGGIASAGASAQRVDELILQVQPGAATQAEVELLTRQSQMFGLVADVLDETGTLVQMPVIDPIALELLDEQGNAVAQMESMLGIVSVDALSGRYALRMKDEDAQKLGVQPVSDWFELPSAQETIAFAADRTRLLLTAVDDLGSAAAGALYQLTDSTGERFEVACDEDGMAVTPLLAIGDVTIETLDAPAGHVAAGTMTVSAQAGKALRVDIVHERHGEAQLSVMKKALSENGSAAYAPVPGVNIRIYRAAQSGSLTDTGIVLTTDAGGAASVRMEAGEYVAEADEQTLQQGMQAPQSVRFAIENTKATQAQLTCPDELGGVRVRLSGGELDSSELAQVRFELRNDAGETYPLTLQNDAFYVGSLAAGTYTLVQTQIPQGYTLCADQTLTVMGGEVTDAAAPLEEYAVVTVTKTGLTFDQALRTYVVPLAGEYGVYTLKDGEMKPYPDAENQTTLWANVTAQEIAEGKAGSAKLPASMEGTTYYLRELSRAPGFAADETYYEVILRAGEETALGCAVSSDRGFFTLDVIDAALGTHVPGGAYELLDSESGETVLAFEMGEQAYQNPMAVPVGMYTLRQTAAASGYALSEQAEISVCVEPYLSEGGKVSSVQMTAARVPQDESLDAHMDVYAAAQQGLTLVSVDMHALDAGQTLHAPQLTIEVGAVGSERSDIASVVIAGTGDAAGGAYRARVEYCLDGGGWQPSDARETSVLTGPTAVSLDDVHDDVRAVRVTYLDARTGEEIVQGGFTPGQVTLSVEASAQGEVNMQASASFAGTFVYRTTLGGAQHRIARKGEASAAFAMQADGLFETVSAGRDGRIAGVAFFDEDADGVMDETETGRYAGLTVSLLTDSGELVDSMRTGADGSYAFSTISGGAYQVQFDAGEGVVFSRGDLYSAHAVSSIEDMRYGASAVMPIDGDHTDYVVNVGCIFAAEIAGAVFERLDGGETMGFSGLSVEMRAANADEDEEPLVVVTGGMGEFGFGRILPGVYDVTIDIPEGYLCSESENGTIVRRLELGSGDAVSLGTLMLEKASSVYGHVRVDEDGDGTFDEGAKTLEGVRVALLRAQDAHTDPVAETTTDAYGAYAFENLYSGDYSVLFELPGDWAFTRYGGDSCVYGAVSQNGASQVFTLEPGASAEHMDAGVTMPTSLTVAVFADTQYDGQKGVYENMLSGVTLSLIRQENGADAEEISFVTDETGTVVFDGVSPGEYVLAYRMPGQWRTTRQAESETHPVSSVPQSMEAFGRSESFTLGMGDLAGGTRYIGAALTSVISGIVYYDDDADAKHDEGEAACMDVVIELLDRDDAVVAVTAADETGAYRFEGLAPGRYSVRFTAAQDCGFSGTERTAARSGVLESDSHISKTRAIAVADGQTVASANAGVVRLGAISGWIWEDRDADRLQGSEEKLMSGVSVHLMDGAGRNIIRTVQTDEQGRYAFDALKPATYKLRVDLPEGYVFSGAIADSQLVIESERDGRGYTPAFALLGGVRVENVAFGLLTQGTISGRVWEDSDFDGLMEDGEDGLRGVTVALINEHGEQIAARQTIRSGEFTFDQLMPGDYSIRMTLPDGYVPTCEGGDSAASLYGEASFAVGSLSMGGVLDHICVGALKTAAVGGVVWYDQDDDGRRGNNETGMSGVRVRLTMTSGADEGTVYETQTDETGAYRFEGVMPGGVRLTYTLEDGYAFARRISGVKRVSSVEKTDALMASGDEMMIRSGETRADLDVGVVGVGVVSGVIFEDSTYDGRMQDSESAVEHAQVELVETASGRAVSSVQTDESGNFAIGFARKGEYSLRVTLPEGRIFTRAGESAIADVDDSNAQTATFRLEMGEGRSDLRIGAITPAVVTGRVVIDENEDGECADSERGMQGAVVTAMQGGTVVATAYADASGSFAFDKLRPGEYRLRYVLGEEALFGKNTGLNMAGEDALEGETGTFTLNMGDQAQVRAVGVVLAGRIAGSAFMDENVDGLKGSEEAAMAGVTVELLDGSQAVMDTAITDEAGRYAFERLRPGTYAVRFTLGENVLFTDHIAGAEGSCVPVTEGRTGESERFSLSMGEEKASMHVGGILPGRIGDTVWHDKDGNGLQDYKEPLIPGVQLTLLYVNADGTMSEAATTVSDEYGYYAFDSLRPGTYVLRLDAREGDTLTFSFGEPLGEIDSDLDPDTGVSAHIALRSGQTLRNIDVGMTDHAE